MGTMPASRARHELGGAADAQRAQVLDAGLERIHSLGESHGPANCRRPFYLEGRDPEARARKPRDNPGGQVARAPHEDEMPRT